MKQASFAELHVAIIGAGGLGGPVAYALAEAGVPSLTIIDDDTVELSNLQRQIHFRTEDLGKPKVACLGRSLERRGYPNSRVRVHERRIDKQNIAEITEDADLLIDCSDNFATKFTVNDHALATNRPCVIASVLRNIGQIACIHPGHGGCYRCLFESPPNDSDTQNCATAGVFGATVAIVAGLAAKHALTLALPTTTRASSRILFFEDLTRVSTPRIVEYQSRHDCTACRLHASMYANDTHTEGQTNGNNSNPNSPTKTHGRERASASTGRYSCSPLG